MRLLPRTAIHLTRQCLVNIKDEVDGQVAGSLYGSATEDSRIALHPHLTPIAG